MSREYKRQMLLKREKDGELEIFRVLDVLENVLVINCVKRSMPVWKTTEELSEYVEMEEQKEEKILSPKQEQEANRIYNIISPVIPFISNESLRTDSIKEVAKRYEVSEQFIRKYLCIYLSENAISSLAPKIRNEGRELTRDEKNIRKSLNKWYYTTKKRTLKNCYTLMLENYYCDEAGKLLEEYPSYYKFRYFYRKYNKPSTEMISRNSLSYYQRNQRPLVGDGVQGFAGTVGMGMLDATVCDIYLVNESGELVGRPIFTSCVDAFTGLVCGYSLSWEGGIYSLRDLMLNVITDKVEHCKYFGINIKEEQWPSHQLPLKLVTDQGSEYKGFNFENIADLGVEVINLQAYRAEQKGPVEKSFDVIQGYMSPYLKGKGYVEPDFQERGVHDYRKDACLTMQDFEKILLHCILFYNSSRIIGDYRLSDEMLADGLSPVPCKIWKWASENIGANLLDVDKDRLVQILLPRTTAKFTRQGLSVNGLHYHNNLYRESYLERKECLVAYDPDSSNYVWVIENGAFIRFELIETRFKNKSIDDVESMKLKQRQIVKKEEKNKTQAEIDLARNIKLIADMASGKDSPSIKNIRENRQVEQLKSHKNFVKEVGVNG